MRTTVQRPLWWVLLAGAAFTAFSLSATALLPQGDGRIGSPVPFANSEHALTAFYGLSGFVLYSFFAAILAGLSVIRDDEHQVSELIHSTPLKARDYVAGKFLGVFAALLIVLGLQTTALMLFNEVLGAGGQPTGPFAVRNYIVPALGFGALPVLFFTGVAFAVGEWTRTSMVVLAIPVLIVFALPILTFWSPPWLAPALNEALVIVDPSGIRWLLQRVLRDAPSVDFVNTMPVALDRSYWANRLGLLVVSVSAVISTVPHVRRVVARGGAANTGSLRRRRDSGAAPTADDRPHRVHGAPPPLSSLGMTAVVPSFWASARQILRAELRELFHQPALYLFVPLFAALVLDEGTSGYGPFGDRLILTAGTMSLSMLGVLTFLVCTVVLFFTVESIHRDDVTGFRSILFACPVRTGAMLVAKNLTNAVVALIVVGVALLVAVPQLVLQPAGRIELAPFVIVWGGILLPTLVFWAALVTAIVAIVRDRYTSYAVGLSILLVSVYAIQTGRMTWVYNWTAVGALRWSDMATFDLDRAPLLLNRALVLSVAAMVAVIAVRAFPRVAPDGPSRLERLRPQRWLREGLSFTPLALVPLLLVGTLAFQIRSGFQGDAAVQRDRDYWRQNVEAWSGAVPPAITHVDLDVGVEPADRWLSVTGTYTMVNATDAPIEAIPFTTRVASQEIRFTLDGVEVGTEDRSGLHVLRPDRSLLPGDTVSVGFSFEAEVPAGFTRHGGALTQFVLPSGVVLHTLRNSFLPAPGFQEGIGVHRDNYAEPAPVSDTFWTVEQVRTPPYTSRVRITAPSNYTMNSVGRKTLQTVTGEGTDQSRTTTVWESDHPVGAINIVGGQWDVVQEGSTAVYYHPGHAYNVDEILHTLVAARTRYSEWFYPYPWTELRLSEYPNHNLNAMGFPTNIPFSEGLGFLSQTGATVPTAFVVTAHEAAHQWWGNIVSAASGPGTGHLVEGLASYSAMLLLDAELGPESRREHFVQLETSYLLGRSPDSERPLASTVGDEGVSGRAVVFDKGALVQWMLQEYMGREAALGGLRDFARHYAEHSRRPALQHMLPFLRAQAADTAAFDGFVQQWFFDVVLPEYRIASPRVTASGGRWEVAFELLNAGTGVMPVEVEIRGRGGQSQRTTVRAASGQPIPLRMITDFEPASIIVDPDAKVLQRNRSEAERQLRL